MDSPTLRKASKEQTYQTTVKHLSNFTLNRYFNNTESSSFEDSGSSVRKGNSPAGNSVNKSGHPTRSLRGRHVTLKPVNDPSIFSTKVNYPGSGRNGRERILSANAYTSNSRKAIIRGGKDRLTPTMQLTGHNTSGSPSSGFASIYRQSSNKFGERKHQVSDLEERLRNFEAYHNDKVNRSRSKIDDLSTKLAKEKAKRKQAQAETLQLKRQIDFLKQRLFKTENLGEIQNMSFSNLIEHQEMLNGTASWDNIGQDKSQEKGERVFSWNDSFSSIREIKDSDDVMIS